MASDIVLFCKRDLFSQQAASVARALFGEQVQVFSGTVGDPMPDVGDAAVLLSFLSPWIVPQALLDRSGLALNFHPGSTDYPGIGCYNFALYEEAEEFGCICHHMAAKVDTGAIVDERRFAVLPNDTVETLKLRTMVTMLSQFHDIATLIALGKRLPEASVHWSRRPFTRREMEALKECDASMSQEEIARRLRATIYPGYPGPYMMVDGEKDYFPVPKRPALA